ncbi:hypothetical protein C8R45DRAFT_1085556 [Mycena sanguinolenta]|nr:hypothetical protein C8R45DRAFT_1085556 [Mycena sanguinolenta]
MLVILCFWLWPLLGLLPTHAATINSSDTSIYYSPGWSQEYSTSTQSSYMQTDGFDCYLSVTLPSNATSVSYVGFKRAGGSMYGYTLDCDTNCLLQTVNATDSTVADNANAPESTLFTIAMDPSTQHILYVYNIPSDLVDGSSEITLNNLNVAFDDVSTSSPILPVSNARNLPSTSSAGPTSSAQTSTSTTPTSSSSSASATSRSLSATSTSGVDTSGGATSTSIATGPSAVTGSQTPSVPVLPIASASPSPTSDGSANGTANASAPSDSNGGGSSPRTVAIGVGVLGGIFGVCVIVALIAFIRQRRKRRNNDPESSLSSSSSSSFSGSRRPASTGSLIPIMPPPQMRQTSELYTIPNPFMDPPSEISSDAPSLDLSYSSAYTQRRMEGRSSPGSPMSAAPTIPLPDIPRGPTEGRSESPSIASYARNDLWITRSPAKPAFSSLT